MRISKYKILFILKPWIWPGYFLSKLCKPVPVSVAAANFIFQRVIGINKKYSFPIHFTSTVSGDVKIGRNVWISFAVSGGCYIQGANGIEIGDDALFAPGVKIISANHSLDNHDCWDVVPPVRIGKNVWIGTNVVILPGIQIGDGAVIGAGSIVTRNVDPGELAVGNPAKVINRSKKVQE